MSAIVPASADGKTLLVSSPGGGVWRSTDDGATWSVPANTSLTDYSVVHLEQDVLSPKRIYALTWSALYATTDAANSWTALINPGAAPAPFQPYQTKLADPKPFAQMRFSVTQSVVLAGLPCSGLYYSFDGVHFTQTWPFPGGSANPDNCIATIASDPFAGRVYFSTLALDPSGAAHVFRSNCVAPIKWEAGTPCLNWEPANTGLPMYSIMSSMIALQGGGPLIAQTTQTGSATSTYISSDGLNWTLQSTVPSLWAPRTLIQGGGHMLLQGNVNSYLSPDLGVHWFRFAVPSEHPDVRGMFADANLHTLWTVSDGSMSGGYANITRWNMNPGGTPTGGVDLGHNGLKVWQAYFAGVIPRTTRTRLGSTTSRRVFMGSQDNASLCNDTLGPGGWTDSGVPRGGGLSDEFGFAVAPSDTNRAYAWNGQDTFDMTSNAASASSCANVVWNQVAPSHQPAGGGLSGPTFWSHHALAVHPTNPNRLYFALLLGIGIVDDASLPTPVVVHHSLPGNYMPTSIYVDAAGAIYVGTADHGAFVSTDDGATWSAWGPGTTPSPALVTAITRSTGPIPTFWMATTDGLYRKVGTGSWALAKNGGGYTVSDVTVDPHCPTRVYAAYGFVFIRGQHGGGIVVTSNNGFSWTAITPGAALHQTPVSSVQVDPVQSNLVFASSYGRGFWVYDWGSHLPACKL